MIKVRKDKTGFVLGIIIATPIALSILLMPSYLQGSFACTNWKSLPDDDCDGLANDWENAHKYDPDRDGVGVSLAGANSQHKDLFVEIDTIPGMTLSTTAIQHVKDAFALANVWNPGGELGIKLQITVDTGTPLSYPPTNPTCWNIWGDFDSMTYGKPSHIGTASERSANPHQYLEEKDVKLYGALIGQQCGASGSSGNSEIPGNDFVLSLGGFPGGGNVVQQESALMHELGHTLNLNHGGSAPTPNCKPNYLSVMNWGMQFADDVPGRKLDFSRWTITPGLNEMSLNEQAGIGPSSPAAQPTAVGHTNPPTGIWRILPATTNNSPINYNGYTGDTDPPNEPVTSAIHDWNRAGCTDNTLQTIYGYNDWWSVQFWTGAPNYVNITLPGGSSSFGSNESTLISEQPNLNNTLQPNLNNSLQANLSNTLQQGLQCNPLEKTCSLNPCDPLDPKCDFEKRTDFSGITNLNQDYGNRIENHVDQSFNDLKAVHHDNLMDFNNTIQTLPKEAFSDTTNATDVKHDFEVKIVTGNNSLVKLVEDNDFNGAVLKLNELKNSLPALFIEPFLTPLQNNTQFLIAGLTNMIPDNGQNMVQQK